MARFRGASRARLGAGAAAGRPDWQLWPSAPGRKAPATRRWRPPRRPPPRQRWRSAAPPPQGRPPTCPARGAPPHPPPALRSERRRRHHHPFGGGGRGQWGAPHQRRPPGGGGGRKERPIRNDPQGPVVIRDGWTGSTDVRPPWLKTRHPCSRVPIHNILTSLRACGIDGRPTQRRERTLTGFPSDNCGPLPDHDRPALKTA